MENKEINDQKPAGGQNNTRENDVVKAPSIELPKGGGAIKGIDEKFKVNPSNGSAAFSIPLPLPEGRNKFSPSLGISYNSGTGNSILGIGWGLDLPAIQRKTDKQLPCYRDDEDGFKFTDAEDLVPLLEWDTDHWEAPNDSTGLYTIRRYRPRIESSFSRIEQITHPDHGTFWRVCTAANITTFFGYTAAARIADPSDATKIFQWLPELSLDDKGNCIVYGYLKENLVSVSSSVHEKNRISGLARFTNSYLKHVKYGNRTPYYIDGNAPYVLPAAPADFLFELVFDFGGHNAAKPLHNEAEEVKWPSRVDPFSSFRSGFEIRTYRLLKRLLVYHRFDELNGGNATLVNSVDFNYALSSDGSPQDSEVTYLHSVEQCGYVLKPDATYSRKTMPSIEFTYETLNWSSTVKNVTAESAANLPAGLSGSYQWMDFYGEGISGIFSEQGGGWFYKPNLGDMDETGNLRLGTTELLAQRPSFSGMSSGVLELTDVDADGRKQLVIHSNGLDGFFELSDENDWQPFRQFGSQLNLDLRDPNLRMVDLDGDGKPDLLISEDDVFTFALSKGKEGYAAPAQVEKSSDEEKGPAVLFSDPEQTIFLADINGDGLTDILRIRNGDVCYWPGKGYGKFGAKITMSNAPLFDTPDLFNPAGLVLADVSGTGASDILYLGKNKCTAYLNLSGNAWSSAQEITPVFTTEKPNKISVIDLLGNGTACIVWSSGLPAHAENPMRYIDLMSGKKPHLLKKYVNNLGREISLEYKNSTWFYLKDKLAGKPWITKLPFPVHCVRKTTSTDKVMNVQFTSEYRYHHGYYDHAEREFRGFGMVEALDTEHVDHWVNNGGSVGEAALQQPPMLTRTWYHTGAFLDKEKILTQFSHEYWTEEIKRQGFAITVNEHMLPDARVAVAPTLDPSLIHQLTDDEWREALRACKGMTLRQEIFALDAPPNPDSAALLTQLTPYSMATHNCHIELLQQKQNNRFAVFTVKESETLTYFYERNHLDPRISHTLNIAFDELGNILETASVVYGRKVPDGSLPATVKTQQQKILITYTRNRMTDDIISRHEYRLRTLAEEETFELKGVPKTGAFYKPANFEGILTAASDVAYHDWKAEPAANTSSKRLIEHVRMLFYNKQLTAALPLYHQATHGIAYETYRKAYTPALVNDIFPGKVDVAMLNAGLFVHNSGDSDWWTRSGVVHHLDTGETETDARQHFYVPVAYEAPFGAKTKVRYRSNYYLLVEETEDELNTISRVDQFNYRTLKPRRMRDGNNNISETVVDELGRVKAMAHFGKGAEADDLSGFNEYTDPAETQAIADFFSSTSSAQLVQRGKALLHHATARFVYDLHRYHASGGAQPAAAASIVRERHHAVDPNSPVQLSFEYSNGGGSVIMKKMQAEPGPAKQVTVNPDDTITVTTVDTSTLVPPQLRWLGNGRTVLNNKGKAVKQYESYFSVSHHYESNKELVETGVTPLMYYDPTGRLIKTELANGTFSKTIFLSWKQQAYDVNDTVLQSSWYHKRFNGLINAELTAEGRDPVKEKEAAVQAALHNDTPTEQHFDTLGRPILSIHHNKDESNNNVFLLTETTLDIEGNARSIIDPRGIPLMLYKYSMLGDVVYQESKDAGRRWSFHNMTGSPFHDWDERGFELISEYDVLNRLTGKRVKGGDGAAPLNHLVEKRIYGEGLPGDINANLRTRLVATYDTAGKTRTLSFDFKGNTLQSEIRFATKYKEVVNWDVMSPDTKLDAATHSGTFTYDALNRIVTHHTHDGTMFFPQYNEAGLLEKVKLDQGAGDEWYVKDIDYNEKGQRSKIVYGNDVFTIYTYDKEMFRLIRMETKQKNGDPLQDYYYTYDPQGNISHIEDKNIPEVFFNNQKITGVATFIYDAVYQLREANGREHIGQVTFPPKDNFDDLPFLKKYSQNDPMAWRNYTQKYRYDKSGNIEQMKHIAGIGSWTRDYTPAGDSNRLLSTDVDGTNFPYDHHLKHGFITSMPHLKIMRWNFAGELCAVAKQSVSGGGTPETTYYVYDSGGTRVRKITEWEAGVGVTDPPKKSERLYFGPVEEFISYDSTGAVNTKRTSYHVMDDKNRVAMIERRTEGTDESPKRLVRYQLSNHIASASIELDDDAAVISYEEYHPFGTTAYQAVDKDIKASYKRYRFTGKERDEESGLEYHNRRYYSVWLGRWLSPDPISVKGGLNLYRYSGNNPVVLIDPNGTDPRLSVDQTTHTITYSTTYHMYASAGDMANVQAQAQRAQQFFANAGGQVNINGVDWNVRYDVNFQFHDTATNPVPGGFNSILSQFSTPSMSRNLQLAPGLAGLYNATQVQAYRQATSQVPGFTAGDNVVIFAGLPLSPQGNAPLGGTVPLIPSFISQNRHPTIPYRGLIALDPAQLPTPDHLFRTLIHEVGHTLGFDERYMDTAAGPISHPQWANDFMSSNPSVNVGFDARHREDSARFAIYVANNRNVNNVAINGIQVDSTNHGNVPDFGGTPSAPVFNPNYPVLRNMLERDVWSVYRRQLTPPPPIPRIQILAPPQNQVAPWQIMPQYNYNPGPGANVPPPANGTTTIIFGRF